MWLAVLISEREERNAAAVAGLLLGSNCILVVAPLGCSSSDFARYKQAWYHSSAILLASPGVSVFVDSFSTSSSYSSPGKVCKGETLWFRGVTLTS